MNEDAKVDSRLLPVTVISNDRISDEGWYLRFHREFDFLPGQVIGLTLGSEMVPRLYSIASGAGEDHVGILYSVKPGGQLTPSMATLRRGDSIRVTVPSGSFLQRPGKGWWIATGTGIAPFLSWMRSDHSAPERLIFGAKTTDGLFFRDELARYCPVGFIPCISQEPDAEGFPGRVTDFIADLREIPGDVTFYLCGLNEMVIDVRDILLSKSVSPAQIVAEIYF